MITFQRNDSEFLKEAQSFYVEHILPEVTECVKSGLTKACIEIFRPNVFIHNGRKGVRYATAENDKDKSYSAFLVQFLKENGYKAKIVWGREINYRPVLAVTLKWKNKTTPIAPLKPQEKILCSAVWFKDGKEYSHQPKNIADGFVMCGYRHCDIYEQIKCVLGSPLNLYNESGFITNQNRFVNRKEALEIAQQSLQVPYNETATELYSEDLY